MDLQPVTARGQAAIGAALVRDACQFPPRRGYQPTDGHLRTREAATPEEVRLSRRRKPLHPVHQQQLRQDGALPVTCNGHGRGGHDPRSLGDVMLGPDGETVYWRQRQHGKAPVTDWRGGDGNTFMFTCKAAACRSPAGNPRDVRITQAKLAEAIIGLRAIGARELDISLLPC